MDPPCGGSAPRSGSDSHRHGLRNVIADDSSRFLPSVAAANATKAQFQATLDSTALMLSKNAANLSASDLQAQATKYFTAMFTNTQAQNIAITTSYSSTGGSKILLNGTATLPTNFLGLLRRRHGAIRVFGSRSCSTIPARWRATTR